MEAIEMGELWKGLDRKTELKIMPAIIKNLIQKYLDTSIVEEALETVAREVDAKHSRGYNDIELSRKMETLIKKFPEDQREEAFVQFTRYVVYSYLLGMAPKLSEMSNSDPEYLTEIKDLINEAVGIYPFEDSPVGSQAREEA